jgi:serine/threonine protein kinase/Tfp pilus assembly protein PilF
MRNAELKQLFQAALDCDSQQRAAFLAAACADDALLRQEVESLLLAFSMHPDFLQAPAFKLSAAEIAEQALAEKKEPSLVGQMVGSYRLLREIGHGGMGVVFLAARNDGHYDQQVALKLIKRGMDSQEVVRRFRRERQILANLAHPNISRLLDGGVTSDGRPYFVMEYVAGEPINEYARARQLSTAERLQVFLAVCTAVHYAHLHHVIHRDIKPGNILIMADGSPKLLDFGIAKLLDSEHPEHATAETASPLHLLTPEYASPEQLLGLPLTAASDVYALGVVLYELLTGQRPFSFNSRTAREILQSAVSTGPQKPSTVISLQGQSGSNGKVLSEGAEPEVLKPLPNSKWYQLKRELRGDLDNIVLMALRKEPERRYPSVELLAEDIRRHLNGSPIVARKDTVTYRSSKFFKRNMAAVISALLVALVFLVVGALLTRFTVRSKTRASIAVLPFVNSSHDPTTEYLAEGITDGLINSLARFSGLSVPAHNSVFRYQGQTIDPQSVGPSLNVATVLTGTVDTDGDNISITVALFETSRKQSIWHKQYTGKSWDLQMIQQEIAQELASKLGVNTGTPEGMRSQEGGTQDSEAYRLYLRGNYFWNRRTFEGLNKGVTYFQQAIAKDPNYALAYCGLANSYTLLGAYESLPPADSFGKAKVAAAKALEIDPNLAEAHTSLAMTVWLYDWDWSAADREFSRSIELNPNYPTGHHWYGLFLGEMGRFDQAIDEEKRALALDPASVPISADLGRVYFYARRYDESLAQYRKAIELDPDWLSFYGELAYLYEQIGMPEEMVLALERVDPHPEAKRAFAAHGINGYWRKRLDLAEQQPSTFSWYNTTAELNTRLGENDTAIKRLNGAFAARDHLMTQLKVNPVFDPLRSDPRFAELMARMNLKP